MKNSPINILMIEDSPLDAGLIMEMLQKEKNFSFNLKHVSDLSTGLDCLAKEKFNLVLLDLLLPDSLGLDTFDKVIAQAPDLPIIIGQFLNDRFHCLWIIQIAQGFDCLFSYLPDRIIQ